MPSEGFSAYILFLGQFQVDSMKGASSHRTVHLKGGEASGSLVSWQGTVAQNEMLRRWQESPPGEKCEGRRVTVLDCSVLLDCWILQTC